MVGILTDAKRNECMDSGGINGSNYWHMKMHLSIYAINFLFLVPLAL